MPYTDAPSTKMLFQHCLVCGRPLRDAISVEFGIGPTCRSRCGLVEGDLSEPRQACNKLIHDASVIVIDQLTTELPQLIQAIHDLGFHKVAEVVSHRFIPIRITEGTHPSLGDVYEVILPYKENFGSCLRHSCHGVEWDKAEKAYYIKRNPANRASLWRCLKNFYSGTAGYSKSGIFLI